MTCMRTPTIDCPQQLFLLKINQLNYLLWSDNECIWSKMAEVQNSCTAKCPCSDLIPGDNKGYRSLTYPSREILHIHRQGSVCFLPPFPSRSVYPSCILESFIFYSFAVLHWIGVYIDCFQLFATLNRVAMNNLE